MKLFPCFTIATLCATFTGCVSQTQTVHFDPVIPEQSDIVVTIDGAPIGAVPVSYELMRTKEPRSHRVVFSKPGYISEEMTLESYPSESGYCEFLEDFPVPELIPDPAGVSAPEPKEEIVADEESVDDSAVVPAPEPKVEVVADGEVAEEFVADDLEEEVVNDISPVEADRGRTLKDIEAELKSLSAQRHNGSLSEADFRQALAELEKEVQTRYAK